MDVSIGDVVIGDKNRPALISLIMKDAYGGLYVITSTRIIGDTGAVYIVNDTGKHYLGMIVHTCLDSENDICIIQVTARINKIHTFPLQPVEALNIDELPYKHFEVILHTTEDGFHHYPVTYHHMYNSTVFSLHLCVNISRELAYSLSGMSTKIGALLVILDTDGNYTPVGHFELLDVFAGNAAIFTLYGHSQKLLNAYQMY